MAEKPKEGSRKRAVFDLFTKKTGTYDVALAKGLELGVKEGTVRSWCLGWDRSKVPARPAKAPPKKGAGKAPAPGKEKRTGDKTSPAPKRAQGPPLEFLPHFKHKTRDAAGEHIAAVCKNNGVRASAFHILEEQGRYAVVPAHHKAPSPPPLFKKGDVVFDAYIPNGMATVTGPGAEQTEIKYKHPRPAGQTTNCVSNYYLHKLTPAEIKEANKSQPKTKPKRERL